MTADGRPHAVRLATQAEIASDESLRVYVAHSAVDQWIALRPVLPFPKNARICAHVPPGMPSREGPAGSAEARSFCFCTAGPLALQEGENAKDRLHDPSYPLFVEATNEIDRSSFHPSMVSVEPELPDMSVIGEARGISIRGKLKPRTVYRVTVAPGLRDTYGQQLESPAKVAFRVGPAPESLKAAFGSTAVLPLSSAPALMVSTVNLQSLKVRYFAVRPDDYPTFLEHRYPAHEAPKITPLPGRRILARSIKVKAAADEEVTTKIELTPLLGDGPGQGILVIEPGGKRKTDNPQKLEIWIQRTDIGLSTFADNNRALVWASSLTDGSPLNGVEITFPPGGERRETGADGTAFLPFSGKPQMIVARKGRDVAVLSSPFTVQDDDAKPIAWHVFDDRFLYRPGEEVHLKGWIRDLGRGPHDDVALPSPMPSFVSYRLDEPEPDEPGGRRVRAPDLKSPGILGPGRLIEAPEEVIKGNVPTSRLGGFEIAFKVPMGIQTGRHRIALRAAGSRFVHDFEVQEFRRPAFEVESDAGPTPHIAGDASVRLTASYFGGGLLQNADVEWELEGHIASFRPPHWDAFTFDSHQVDRRFFRAEIGQSAHGVTDRKGNHEIKVKLREMEPGSFEDADLSLPMPPISVVARASVLDVDRRQVRTSKSFLLHPAALVVGLRQKEPAASGRLTSVEFVVTTVDGGAVANQKVSLRAVALTGDDWNAVEIPNSQVEAEQAAVLSADQPVEWQFHPKHPGFYRVTAVVADDKGRRRQSDLLVRATGAAPDAGLATPSPHLKRRILLSADKTEYHPGDVARITLAAPFYPAEGLLTLRRSGLVEGERFTVKGPKEEFRIPIIEAHIPNLEVGVELEAGLERASDAVMLQVPPKGRVLNVAFKPRTGAVRPGDSTAVRVVVTDAKGRPVRGAEVTLVVVDEAVLAVSGYRLTTPMATFYPPRRADVEEQHLRDYLVDTDRGAGHGWGTASGVAMPEYYLRKDFNPLALFKTVATDAEGLAAVSFRMPDNVTRYRVSAIAAKGAQSFGFAESSIRASLGLVARPSFPRFLTVGDRAELPIVLHNNDTVPRIAALAVRVHNLELTSGAGRRVTVPPHGSVEVRVPVSASRLGTARVQAVVESSTHRDTFEAAFPIIDQTAKIAAAVYGTIDEGAVTQPIEIPLLSREKSDGGIEITASASALTELLDAVLYLKEYPYECSEQTASRILVTAALGDVLDSPGSGRASTAAERKAEIERDVAVLLRRQGRSGGFAHWDEDDAPLHPFVSAHAATALAAAKAAGIFVPDKAVAGAARYLRGILETLPEEYDAGLRYTVSAYALFARHLLGEKTSFEARALIRKAGGASKLPIDAVSWVLQVLTDEKQKGKGRREIGALSDNLVGRVVESAAAAHFAFPVVEGGHLVMRSAVRSDAVALAALLAADPDNSVIPKIVQGLLDARRSGRWADTQENAFAALALARYLRLHEADPASFALSTWVGKVFHDERALSNRGTNGARVFIPLTALPAGTENVTLVKRGEGRLYYRVGLRYASPSSALPFERGFSITRTYEALDAPSSVRRDADGTWHIKAGCAVRVRLSVAVPDLRYNAALVDPLPGGLEPEEEPVRYASTRFLDRSRRSATLAFGHRSHQNRRDSRIEIFADTLPPGIFEFFYTARALTPGSYLAFPPHIEEMYAPETFGRGTADRVIVE